MAHEPSSEAWELEVRHLREIINLHDRRYAEVSQEREKALKIKEQADRDALDLARQIQSYKDEKANELREQINSERGHYASKDDLIASVEKIEAKMNPLLTFAAAQQGGSKGMRDLWGWLVAGVLLIVALIGLWSQ